MTEENIYLSMFFTVLTGICKKQANFAFMLFAMDPNMQLEFQASVLRKNPPIDP